MTYKAVDRHNMMEEEGSGFRELKIQTFVFRFLGLVITGPNCTVLADVDWAW